MYQTFAIALLIVPIMMLIVCMPFITREPLVPEIVTEIVTETDTESDIESDTESEQMKCELYF